MELLGSSRAELGDLPLRFLDVPPLRLVDCGVAQPVVPDRALLGRIDFLAALDSRHLIERCGDLRRVLLGKVRRQIQSAAIEVEHDHSPT